MLPFLETEVIFASLMFYGNSVWLIELLKMEWGKSVKMSAFSLVSLDEIIWIKLAFDTSNFKIPFKT